MHTYDTLFTLATAYQNCLWDLNHFSILQTTGKQECSPAQTHGLQDQLFDRKKLQVGTIS